MKHYMSIADIADIHQAIKACQTIKADPYRYQHLGKNQTLGMIFMNPSLRTKISTMQAAYNLGMNVMPIDFNQGGWPIELRHGVTMDGDKSEHIKEAASVIGAYCNIIGIRSFAGLKNFQNDQREMLFKAFQAYSGSAIVNLESETRHPLQMLADLLTIEQYKQTTKDKPKVVLSWAPHEKALPHAVVNSFLEGAQAMNYNLCITHPQGYELDETIVGDTPVYYDQNQALQNADFVYVKNWSSYHHYGQILNKDRNWQITQAKMALTSSAKLMHCLPVRRNLVVDENVLDGPDSVVIQQAKNRLYAAQYVLQSLLESKGQY